MSLPVCTVNTNNIQNLPDSPTLSSDELKQEFDKSGKDLKNYINEILLPAVEKLIRDEKSNLETSINNKILADNKKKYHIGKIIMSTENINPSTYLGFGTWEFWGSGRVPIGVDSTDEDFNTAEKTGGEKTHILTESEMPSHKHIDIGHRHNGLRWISDTEPITLNEGYGVGYNLSYKGGNAYGYNNIVTAFSQSNISNAGGDAEHNNLQPYITCFMWKRVS